MGRPILSEAYAQNSLHVVGRLRARQRESHAVIQKSPDSPIDGKQDRVNARPMTQTALKRRRMSLLKNVARLQKRINPFLRRIDHARLRTGPEKGDKREQAQQTLESLRKFIAPWERELGQTKDRIQKLEAQIRQRQDAHRLAQQAFLEKQKKPSTEGSGGKKPSRHQRNRLRRAVYATTENLTL
jgi:predicted  nucleic acid-binding Zn-ribbon protein